MAISPRIDSIPAITNEPHNQPEENNIVALVPQTPAEPTLLEITKPEVTFEELSSQL